jgi:hypothetical protein
VSSRYVISFCYSDKLGRNKYTARGEILGVKSFRGQRRNKVIPKRNRSDLSILILDVRKVETFNRSGLRPSWKIGVIVHFNYFWNFRVFSG